MSRKQSQPLSRFDQAAAEWDANPSRVALARAVADAIRDRVPLKPSMHVMDCGAGTGLVALRLQPHVATIAAMDSSRKMLKVLAAKVAAAHIGNVTTRFWDMEQGPSPETGFDAVVSSMTLHHLNDTRRIAHRLCEALKPGGWLALADLDREDGTFHADPTGVHHHGFDRRKLVSLLRQAGFVGVSARTAHWLTRPGADGKPRTYGIFLITGRKRRRAARISI
jgi:tRNA (cmo5U34)-methyltransferase